MGVLSLIILDTHVWVWWECNPEKLSRRAVTELESATRIGIPAICCWEVAKLTTDDRLKLSPGTQEWMQAALAKPRIELQPITPAIVMVAARLGSAYPGDPADRMIAATAIVEGATLITKDERLLEAPGLKAVW